MNKLQIANLNMKDGPGGLFIVSIIIYPSAVFILIQQIILGQVFSQFNCILLLGYLSKFMANH